MYKFITRKKICNCLQILFVKNTYRPISILRHKSSNIDQLIKDNVSITNDSKPKNRIGITAKMVEKAPLPVQPYLKIMRINRPIGSWLLFWPCGWGVALATVPGSLPDFYLLTLFGAGSLVMRGAGCTINDMWDKDIDSKVARTADRPLVNGSMSIQQAWIFLAGQLSLGLFILLQLNWFSIFLGASSLGLVAIYPLMKRITYWPQFMLGMTFNWGILLGYSAVHEKIDWTICGPIYIAAICWTIIYDTIYAHQDVADDILCGIKSTALKFKENTKYWLSGFSTVMISSLTYSGVMTDQTWPYYSAVVVTASHLIWQIYGLNTSNPQDCARKFISNHHVGLIIFLGIVFGNLMKSNKNNEKLLTEVKR